MINTLKRMFLLVLPLMLGFLRCPGEVSAANIEAEEIKAAITRYVENSMPWPPGTIRLVFPAKVSGITVPGERARLEVQGRLDEGYIGDTTFTVKYYSAGTPVKEDHVRVGLEVQQEVVVAARSLAKNAVLSSEDVRVVRKWVKRVAVNAISSPEDVIGKAVTINLRADSEITRNLLRAPLLVKRGSMVHLVLDDGRLNVSTLGVSEEDGVANAMIKVKNLSSNKIVYGRVASNSLVRVEF